MRHEHGVNEDDASIVVNETDIGWQDVESSPSIAALTENLASVPNKRATTCRQILEAEPRHVVHWSEKDQLWHLVDAAPKQSPKDTQESIPDCPSDEVSPAASRYFLRRPYRGPLIAGKVSNSWHVLRDEKLHEGCVNERRYCTPCLPPDMSPGERYQAKLEPLQFVSESKQFSMHVDSKLDMK